MILLSICIVSCSKVSNIEEEEYISQSLIGEPGAVFAQIVQQNINNNNFKDFVLNNAALRFDGDYNFLVVPTLSSKTKAGNDVLAVPSELMNDIAKEDPLLQIFVLHPENWTENNLPLVVYLPLDFDDQTTEYIDAYTPDGNIISVKVRDTFESQAVVVVSHNERTVAVSTDLRETKSHTMDANPIYETDYYTYYLQEDLSSSSLNDESDVPQTKATAVAEKTIAGLLGGDYPSCGRMNLYPTKDYITRVRPTSKSAWSDIEPAIMGDPELYFYFELGSILGGKGQIKKEKKYIGKGYKNRNNIHWLDLAEAGIDTELFRWSLVDNGTNIRYEWWEDDGGALIDHTTSVSIEIPNALGELISPEPVEVNVKIGKKDDYAGSVYAYYIDENNHIYNTSYVMFEIEYRKQ